MLLSNSSRRDFLAAAGALALSPLASIAVAQSAPKPRVLLFSKHLGTIKDYVKLADTVRGIGYDGIDLAVREKGHVLPENVEADLPKAVEAANAAGLTVDMITTDIQDGATSASEAILKTASALGIKLFRIGGWGYPKDKSIPEGMEAVRRDLAGIAALAAKHGMCAAYQNHSGGDRVGAPIWDLWEMMKEIDPAAMGINFDIGHATVEGGQAWRLHYRLAQPKMKIVTIKDFKWEKGAKAWKPAWGPVGEGMVDLKEFLGMLKHDGFSGPISSHFEYAPKPDAGQTQEDALLAAMKRDLATLRAALTEAGLA